MNHDLGFYSDRAKKLLSQITEEEKSNRRLSVLRLIFFLLFAVFIVLFFVKHMNILFGIISAVFLGVFICLCIVHDRVKTRLEHLKVLSEVNERYISRIKGDFSGLPDKGAEFADTSHEYSYDLDIFGDVSIFALYNISETSFGRRAFANALLGKTLLKDIPEVQKNVSELISRKEFLQEYQAVAHEGKTDKDPGALLGLAKTTNVFPKSYRNLYKAMPVLWVLPLVMTLTGTPYTGAIVLLLVAVNLTLRFIFASKYEVCFQAVNGIASQTNAISRLFVLLENENFEQDLLKELTRGGAPEGKKASEGLKILSDACNFCKVRMQPLFALIFNAFFQYDLLCADKLLTWASAHGKELEKSLDSLAKIETMMCAAVPGLISKESVFPEILDITEDDPANAFFEGENITHPLLDPEKAVSNSIRLNAEIALITGSNMSGKTTLIRTVGICSILSYIGAPVPAAKLTLGRMKVVSSMRIVDSIEEQMSTFRAELIKIGHIVDVSREKKPMLFLIDEIFRGTNSADRTEGAMRVLENLNRPFITGLMTTHDYALCDKVSESIKSIVYYHFSEKYNDSGISFDYKLHDGVSHESNAKYLMKLVGIYDPKEE